MRNPEIVSFLQFIAIISTIVIFNGHVYVIGLRCATFRDVLAGVGSIVNAIHSAKVSVHNPYAYLTDTCMV